MNIAKKFIQDGQDNYQIIQAGEQTGGRGRRGNQWVSPVGNLYQSIILKPSHSKETWGQLSFVIAVAMADFCLASGLNEKLLNLKWPNDVLVDGNKLAGILIEIESDCVVIGTGVNIKYAPDDRSKVNDWCDWSVNECRDEFLIHLKHHFDCWNTDGFENIRLNWLKYAYCFGQEIQARTPSNVYKGIFKDLDEQGTLILKEEDGYIRHINAGEIIACS